MFCGTCITMGGRKGKKDPNAKHAKIFAKHNSFKKDKQCSLQNLDIDTKEMITDAKSTVMHQITLWREKTYQEKSSPGENECIYLNFNLTLINRLL